MLSDTGMDLRYLGITDWRHFSPTESVQDQMAMSQLKLTACSLRGSLNLVWLLQLFAWFPKEGQGQGKHCTSLATVRLEIIVKPRRSLWRPGIERLFLVSCFTTYINYLTREYGYGW